jgi:hypothetical protein
MDITLEQIAEACCRDIASEIVNLEAHQVKRIVEKHLNAARIELVRTGRVAFQEKNKMKMR